MSKNDVKTVTNIENLTVWKRTEGEESTTYGDAVSLVKRLMTVSDNPTTVSDDLYGDGEAVASYSANMGGTLELGLTDLTAADRVLFFGETDEDGTNIVSKTDICNYTTVAYQSRQHNGKLKLTKYVRVLFAPGQEQEQQVTKSGISWSTKTLSGTYTPDPDTGVFKYVRRDVDPTADTELISKWFTNAEYHGEAAATSGE